MDVKNFRSADRPLSVRLIRVKGDDHVDAKVSLSGSYCKEC